MFDWLGDIISGIGSAIGDTIDFISSGVGDAIWNAMLKWLYEIIYGAIADFFEMMGNMGSEVFDLEWVQATADAHGRQAVKRKSYGDASTALTSERNTAETHLP